MSPAGAAPSDATAESDGYGYPDYSTIEPAAGRPAAAQPAAQPLARAATAYPALVDPVMAQRTAALQNEVAKLEERLQRVEKAALRLDRRMQLVERNELGRMNTASADGDSSVQTASADTSADADPDEATSVRVSATRPQSGYGDGFQPVSTPITSALQAAPSARAEASASGGPVQVAAREMGGRLPSLADPAATSSRAPTGEERLAIWTVHYGNEKVWPERDQLPSSRDVVTLLREGGKATLFARGAQPNSRAFRERVKALSRYLAKVTSLDSVPIAALSAPHLDGDTIEIVAQP
ncbi:MAG TPA: hypothetical protein VHP58_03015 [Alphaproteobacteria bacterium]|nr:hypothetical protein [Alphaproteobacteria bacterium]